MPCAAGKIYDLQIIDTSESSAVSRNSRITSKPLFWTAITLCRHFLPLYTLPISVSTDLSSSLAPSRDSVVMDTRYIHNLLQFFVLFFSGSGSFLLQLNWKRCIPLYFFSSLKTPLQCLACGQPLSSPLRTQFINQCRSHIGEVLDARTLASQLLSTGFYRASSPLLCPSPDLRINSGTNLDPLYLQLYQKVGSRRPHSSM